MDLAFLMPGLTSPGWNQVAASWINATQDDYDWFEDMQTSQSISVLYPIRKIDAARRFYNADTVLWIYTPDYARLVDW